MTGVESIRSATPHQRAAGPIPGLLALFLVSLVSLAPAGAGAQTPLSDAIAAYRTSEHEVAFKLFGDLAAKGNAIAQYNLGVMYLTGKGVERDMAEAAKWHRRAAEQGVATAQYGLGVMYYRGDGIAQDHAQAARWFREAARQDYPDAQFNLGVMHFNGQGVPRDMTEVVKWISLAAGRGHRDAMFRLAVMHEAGEPFAHDPAEAIRWYKKAAALGHQEAARRVGALETSVSVAVAGAAKSNHPGNAPRPATKTPDPARANTPRLPTAAIDQYNRPARPAVINAKEVVRPALPPRARPVIKTVSKKAPSEAIDRLKWRVQIASFPTRRAARRAWAGFRRQYGDLLTGLLPRFHRAEIRDKGEFHRLRLGPLENRAAAVELCRELLIRAHSHGCLPIPPRRG